VVLGPARAGKSSLLWLLAGLRRPDSGSVRLDGQDVAAPGASAARRVVLLSPDLPLARGSIKDNLRWHAGHASTRAFEEACRLAQWDELAPPRPAAGGELRLADAALNLTHTQRRSLALARALAARPQVLLIDEPAACLPGPVRTALERLLGGCTATVIFATQDAELALWADEVWALAPPPHAGPAGAAHDDAATSPPPLGR
jgi:ABC-type bacteriocin/lantibiotic exporter with double-glycine peptidase domain